MVSMQGMLRRMRSIFSEIGSRDDLWLHIVELDTEKHLVTLRPLGKSAVFRITIQAAVSDRAIINGLSPIDASVIGYCAAKIPRDLDTSDFSNAPVHCQPEILNSTNCEYVLLHQTRDRDLIFREKKSGLLSSRRASDIFKTRDFIKKLTPNQAFYVGFLTAVEEIHGSDANTKHPPKQKPVLRVVHSSKLIRHG